jgi:hypothetical protein
MYRRHDVAKRLNLLLNDHAGNWSKVKPPHWLERHRGMFRAVTKRVY